MNKIVNNFEIYYKINEDLIKNYSSKNRNYEILQNINEINNTNIIINKLNDVNNDKDIMNKLNKIFNIYKIMNNKKEIKENIIPKVSEKYIKYSDYPKKVFELINNINDDSKVRIIFKKEVKVALFKGEIAFQNAAKELRSMLPLPPLEFKPEICIPLPEKEEDIKNGSPHLSEQVKIIIKNYNINAFFRDLIKIPEISTLLMIVDDNENNSGKKRLTLMDKNVKYIGISSAIVGNTFGAYFSFSE